MEKMLLVRVAQAKKNFEEDFNSDIVTNYVSGFEIIENFAQEMIAKKIYKVVNVGKLSKSHIDLFLDGDNCFGNLKREMKSIELDLKENKCTKEEYDLVMEITEDFNEIYYNLLTRSRDFYGVMTKVDEIKKVLKRGEK